MSSGLSTGQPRVQASALGSHEFRPQHWAAISCLPRIEERKKKKERKPRVHVFSHYILYVNYYQRAKVSCLHVREFLYWLLVVLLTKPHSFNSCSFSEHKHFCCICSYVQADLGVVFGVPSSPRLDFGVAAARLGVCLPADKQYRHITNSTNT